MHGNVYGQLSASNTLGVMPVKKLESKFVRRVMAGAAEAEIEEATRRWFEFIRILDRIATRLEMNDADSRKQTDDGRVANAQ